MDRIEIRSDAGSSFVPPAVLAMLLIPLSFLATTLIVSDRLELSAPIEVVWNAAPE